MIDRDVTVYFNLAVGNSQALKSELANIEKAVKNISKTEILNSSQLSKVKGIFAELTKDGKTLDSAMKSVGTAFRNIDSTGVKNLSRYLNQLEKDANSASAAISKIRGLVGSTASPVSGVKGYNATLANLQSWLGLSPKSENSIMGAMGIFSPLAMSNYGGSASLKKMYDSWRQSGLILNPNLTTGRVVSTARALPSIVNTLPNINYSFGTPVTPYLGARSTAEFEDYYQKALRSFQQMGASGTGTANQLTQSWEQVRQTMMNVGTAVQTVGNAFTSLGNATGIPTLIHRFQYLFTGTMYGALSSGISSGVSRFDTMRTFPLLLQGMGENPANASVAVNRLDMAVRGLPTALNDIVDSTKNLFSINGDLDRATDLAIAMNNAFLSSGATQQQVYFGTQQLRDLLATGKLMDREWISLGKSAPLALKKVASAMGYSSFKSLYTDIQTDDSGKMIDEFFDTLIKLGTGTGELVKLADVQKTTVAGLTANIKNAFSRFIGGDNGLLSIADDFSKKYLGADSLVQYLYGITRWIDEFAKTTRGAVFSHADQILNLIKGLTNYDWVKLISEIAKFEFVKWQVKLKMFEAIGPTLYAIAGTWFPVIGRILTSSGTLIKVFASIGGVAALGKFTGVFKFIGGLTKSVGAVGTVAGGATAVATGGAVLTALAGAFKGTAIIGGITALIAGFGALDTWLIKKAFDNVKAITQNVIDIIANVRTASENAKSFSIPSLDKIGDFSEFVRKFYATFTDDKVLDIGIWDVDGQVGKGESNNIAKIVENMANVISSISKSAKKISSTSLPSSVRIENFKNFFKDISELMVWLYDLRASDQFGTSGTGARIFSGKKFKAIEESMNNVKGIIDSIAHMVTSVHDMVDTLKFLFTTDTKHGSKRIREKNALETRIQWMLEDVFGVANFIQDVFAGNVELTYLQPNGKGGFVKKSYHVNDLGNIQKDLSSMESILGSISGFVSTTHDMVDTLKFLFTTDEKHGSEQIREKNALENRVVWMLEDVFGVVAYIQDIFVNKKEFTFRKLDSKGKWVEATATIDDMQITTKTMESVGSIVTSIGGFVETVDGMVGELTHLFTRGKGSSNDRMHNLTERLIEFMGMVNQIFSMVSRYGFEKYDKVDLSNGVTILENIKSMIGSLKSVKSVIPDEKAKDSLVNTAKYLKSVLNQLWKALNFGENVNLENAGAVSEAWASMLDNVVTLIGKLSSAQVMLSDNSVYSASQKIREELKKLREAIKKTSESISEIGTTWTDGIVAALDGARVTEAMNNVLSALGTDTTIAWMSGWTQGNAVVRGMQSGMSTAPRLLGGAVDIASGNSQGGVIYRAFGGNIFKARGTDTVPAMLTPGEYVIRRSAVNAVGKEFMDRVNSLDFRGALTALSKRVGMGMIPSVSPSFAVTTNETTNHNGTINFNVNTNNPDYPHQVSGKWIRKLI